MKLRVLVAVAATATVAVVTALATGAMASGQVTAATSGEEALTRLHAGGSGIGNRNLLKNNSACGRWIDSLLA